MFTHCVPHSSWPEPQLTVPPAPLPLLFPPVPVGLSVPGLEQAATMRSAKPSWIGERRDSNFIRERIPGCGERDLLSHPERTGRPDPIG